MALPESGSQPLRGRKERFASLLAKHSGLLQVEAYCQSADPPVPVTKGRAVSASRLANTDDVIERAAFLRRKAAQETPDSEPTLSELITLMSDLSDSLISASRLAEKYGRNMQSKGLRKSALMHIGRLNRTTKKMPGVIETPAEQMDSGAMLARLEICDCV